MSEVPQPHPLPTNIVSHADFSARLAQSAAQPSPMEVFVYHMRPTLMAMQHYLLSRPLWPQAADPSPGELTQEAEFKVPHQSRGKVYDDLQILARTHPDINLQVAFYEADDKGPKEAHIMLVGPVKGKENKGRAVATGVIRADREVSLLYLGFKPEGVAVAKKKGPADVVDITARRALRIQQELSEQV